MDRYAKGDTRMYHFQLKINRWHSLWACVCIFLSVGCQTLSLPAIDPTGNRIFSNGWTGVNPIHGSPSNGYPSQQPAYQTPPEPPQCVQGNDGTDKKLCKGVFFLFVKRKNPFFNSINFKTTRVKHKRISTTRIQVIYPIKSTNKIIHLLQIYYHIVIAKKHKK